MLPSTVATQVTVFSPPNALAFSYFRDWQLLSCTLCASLAPVCGVMVVQAHNPVHSVLFYMDRHGCTVMLSLLAVVVMDNSTVLCFVKQCDSIGDTHRTWRQLLANLGGC